MPIKNAAPTCAARPLNPVDGAAPGRGRSRLAPGAPVGGAVGVALSPRFDRRAAAAAAAARTVVDEAALAAGLDGSGHQLVCRLEDGAELLFGNLGEPP